MNEPLNFDLVLPTISKVVDVIQRLDGRVFQMSMSFVLRESSVPPGLSGSGRPHPVPPARASQRCLLVQPNAACKIRSRQSSLIDSGPSMRL